LSEELRVVVCEKPSVARDIATHLKANKKRDGYFEGEGWAVTWAFGHLLELKDPHEYKSEWRSWKVETLPMIPSKFALKAKDDKGVKDQLATLKDLFSRATEIVCATDAGREGELIFRYIQTHLRATKKPFKRLWISSLTSEAIAAGFKNLKNGSDFDPLYRAARCRSEADWIVGLNATRFFTVLHGTGRQLWSVGRVQTPVLSMIVDRDKEIASFEEADYWELYTNFQDVKFKHQEAKFDIESEAQALLQKIAPAPLKIVDFVEKDEPVLPPYLYDLTELQKDMNRRFGMSADQTLKAAQSLYEKKHLTYPRTDSKFLTKDVAAQLPPLLESLKAIRPDEISKLDLEKLNTGPRMINDLKVSDHHALIPTPVVPQARMSQDEIYVYHSVLIRLIAALYPAGTKRSVNVKATILDEVFKASGKVTVDLGWEILYKKKKKKAVKADEGEGESDDNESEGGADMEATGIMQALLKLKDGLEGPHEPFVKNQKTKAPKPFTEATILQMMETAGKEVSDKELRNALKEKGLGTPATRASIIETLLSRKYIKRSAKNIVSTPDGQKLISLVDDQRLKSPELTGEWESQLKQIENYEYDAKTFMKDVTQYIQEIVGFEVADGKSESGWGACPLCKSAIIEGKKAYGCSSWKSGCTFVLPKEYKGIEIPSTMVIQLLRYGKAFEALMVIEDEKQNFVRLAMDEKGVLNSQPCEAPANHEEFISKIKKSKVVGTCPKCRSPIVESTKAYGCSRWQQGCKFAIWKKIAKKKIVLELATQLLEKGQTDLLDGFQSKAGKKFSARLELKDGEVKFQFEG